MVESQGIKLFKKLFPALGAVSLATALAACGGSASSTNASSESGPSTPISIALDFIPNADNSGVFVAKNLGYFSRAGLDVSIVPYGQTPPDDLVSSGRVQFAIAATEPEAIFDFAAGDKVTAVMTVMQHDPNFYGYLASDPSIHSPKNLCGKTYGGFGYPNDPAVIHQMIKDDGGPANCNVKIVTLGSSAYQAVESHKVDFSAFFFSDVIQAEVQQHAKLKTFRGTSYGLPDQYAAVILANDQFLKSHPATAKKFVHALAQAYQYIKANPTKSAQILATMNPGDVNLPSAVKSEQVMAQQYLGPNGSIGHMSVQMWQGYGNFLFAHGLLVNRSGHKLTHNLDYTKFFTNGYF